MKASLSPERWEQVQRLFNEVFDLDAEERAVRLNETCRDDTDLREEVLSLLAAYEQADHLLQSLDRIKPSVPQDPTGSRTGTHVSHYEVLEKLGGGGMGVVYKAYDKRLKRTAALKFLPPRLSINDDAKRRFEREAQAASTLDHNNICTIYEIGETDNGQAFIAMAYYAGETLNKKIAGGPLPVEQALRYAVQTARGLAKAHAHGIIHRDIKPANVMVTDDDVVKIVDFGLAKMADVQLTKTGTTMGTVAYMSPEQARGDKVNAQTDVWSLGVVLYEMLTGQRPFQGEHEQSVIHSILHTKPPAVTRLNPDLPLELGHVVAMALEKRRDRRYATMDEMLADLSVFIPDTASDHGTVLRALKRRRRRGFLIGAGLAVLLALILIIPQSRQMVLVALGGQPPPVTRHHIAVLPLLNNLGEGNQALVDGMTQILTNLLPRLETPEHPLWVVPGSEIFRQDVTSAQEARRLFGANTILEGSVQNLGAETVLTLTLVDPTPASPRIIGTRTMAAPTSPALLEDVLAQLAGLLEVDLSVDAQLAVTTGQATRPDAYAFYVQGVGYLRRYDVAGNLENAIMVFNQALEEDSLYAPAYAGLCESMWEQYVNTKDIAQAEQALAHCDRAAALAEEQVPVLVTLGRIYFETGQYEKAETELERILRLEPNNADAHRWIGRVYARLDRFDEAEAAFRRAVASKPDVWAYYDDLGVFFDSQGRYAEALEQFEQVQRLTPDNYIAYNGMAVEQRNLNEVEKAKQLFQKSLELQPNYLASRNLGRLYFRDQQYHEAAQELERARSFNPADPWTWNLLGHAYYWAGDSTQAQTAWQRVIELAEPSLQITPKEHNLLLVLAQAQAALGNPARSLAYLDNLKALSNDAIYTKYHMARAYAMLNRNEQAFSYIKQALEDRFDPVTIHRDPWFADLLDDPRYQALHQQFLIPDP